MTPEQVEQAIKIAYQSLKVRRSYFWRQSTRTRTCRTDGPSRYNPSGAILNATGTNSYTIVTVNLYRIWLESPMASAHI